MLLGTALAFYSSEAAAFEMLAQEHATALLMCPVVLCHAVSCCAGVVLAAASPYFETLLRGWACSHQPLHMVVGEEQLAAAQQVETGFSKSLLALFSVCVAFVFCAWGMGVWCVFHPCHLSVPTQMLPHVSASRTLVSG